MFPPTFPTTFATKERRGPNVVVNFDANFAGL